MDGRQFRTFAVSVFASLLLAGLAHAAENDAPPCECAGTVARDTLKIVNKVYLPFPVTVTLHKGTSDGMVWYNQTNRNLWIIPFPTDPWVEGRPHSIAVPKGTWSHCYCVSKQAPNRLYHYYVSDKSKMVHGQEKKGEAGGVIVDD
jgi:hypothetical protein